MFVSRILGWSSIRLFFARFSFLQVIFSVLLLIISVFQLLFHPYGFVCWALCHGEVVSFVYIVEFWSFGVYGSV